MRIRRTRGSGCAGVFSVLSAFMLLLACLSLCATAVLFYDPQLNPVAELRPPTQVELVSIVTLQPLATLTPTPALPTLPPEWTATATGTVTGTPLASPTATDTVTRTPFPASWTPTATHTRTITPTPTGPTPTPSNTRSAFQFTLQRGSPASVPNIANSNGCNWFGVSGQVFDLENKGVIGLIVHVEGGGLSIDSLTGSAPKYGVSGYEITLGSTPTDTTNTYRLQLRDGAGKALSDFVTFPTYGTNCATNPRNQTIINFVQNH